MLRHASLVLVVDLVFQTRPKVHGDRANLHLNPNGHFSSRQKDWNLDDGVQTAISVGFRLCNVVLDAEHPNIRLRSQGFEHPVGVCNETAGNPDAGDIGQPCTNCLRREFQVAPDGLLLDARRGLNPRRNMLYGVVLMQVQELFPQNGDFREHLVHSKLMFHREPHQFVSHIPHEFQHLWL